MTRDLFLSMALPGQGSRKGAGFELPRGVGPDHSRSILGKGCPDVLPPGQGNDAGLRVPVSKGKGHVFLGGSGYAKRSTKMALAVVWPKMKAPRVTKSTP